jgi:photosystem II stability/assembly factor-like uncharacterized protein
VTEDNSTTQDFIYGMAASAGFDAGKRGVFFAARNSGLFRSDDGGATWTLAIASLELEQAVAVTAVALPADFERDHTVICGMAGGLLISGDGGKTWQLPNFPPPPPMITAIALSPTFSEDGIALAATMEDGVLRSSDHGRTWVLWNFALLDLGVLSLAISPAFTRDETVFAGTETGIFRSTNGGRAWREVELPVDYDPVLSLAISPAFEQDGTIFAGTESKGLLISRDGGDSWIPVEGIFAGEPVNSILVAPDFAAHPEAAALSDGLAWISRDGGVEWSLLWPELAADEIEISALYAPQGFRPGCPAWVGVSSGDIIQKIF